jgi:hypothetical protein
LWVEHFHRPHAEADFDAADSARPERFSARRGDFSQALKDLEQVEDVAEQIAESASEAGNKEITAELVRIYIREQACSEAAPEPKSKKES